MAAEEKRPVERSIWSYIAPAALLAAITILVLIADSAGWFGRSSATTPAPAPPTPPAVTTTLPSTVVTTTETSDTTASTETTDTSATTDTTDTTGTTGQTDSTGSTETTSTQTTISVTVVKGDTLNAIALRTNTTVARLLELNPGINPQALTIGQEIVVG